MQKFLEKTAAHIYGEHKDDLEKIAVVLPNQRANLFLRKHFSRLLDKPSWSPSFLSIEDFIQEVSDLQVLDNIDLIIELYTIHKEVEGEKAENLDTFLQWANTLLHDFNEIDRYLLDADSLFDYLKDIQRIKHWDPKGNGLTDFQKENIHFWAKLKDYYHLLQKKLLTSNKAYQGLSYKVAAESISDDFIKDKDFKKIYFIGFNALTTAEERIIDFFIQSGIAEMLYDSDAYYMGDSIQEAGKFLRPRWKKDKENFHWVFDDFANSSKTIHTNGLKGNIAQVKAAGNYLKNIPSDELSETAVILSDETLLPALLQSLPNNVQKANITMGFPLDATSTFLLFNELFQLYLNSESLSKNSESTFYYKNLLKVLENPLLLHFESNDVALIKKKINQDKLFYIRIEKIDELQIAKELLPLFQVKESSPQQLLKSVMDFIIFAKDQKLNDPLENEYLFQFMKIFNRLDSLIKENPETAISLKSAYAIFKQMASSSSIPFYGEPLQGLQIMGVLESRTLDFKNLFFLSVNEGILPAGKSMNSFIPYEVKVEKGLPSYKEKDAIFAYHFYRILQRAENIELFYNTQNDSLSGGEESRFIKQLLQEVPEKAPNSTIEEKNLNVPLINNTKPLVEIQKTDVILNQVQEHLKSGLSPSALSTFLTCPLDYYYKYILKMETLEEAEEDLQANSFGNIIHKTLENLYEPFLNQFLNFEIIQKIRKKSEHELQLAFSAENFQIKTGKNHLIYQVALQYINNFLDFEAKRLKNAKDEIQLLIVEKSYNCSINIERAGKDPLNIKLKGKADRIEKEGNLIRIIDFKTGGLKNNELKVKEYSSMLIPEKSKALQLMMYSIIFSSVFPDYQISPNIFFLRSPSIGFTSFSENTEGLHSSEVEEGKQVLMEALSLLLDQNIPFTHSAEAVYCSFCS